MHIITGLIAAAALGMHGKQEKQNQSPLLSLRGILETRHSLPGRIRFYLPCIKGAPEKAKLVEREMPKLKGVKYFKAEPVTATVLIYFDRSIIEPSLLATALIKLLGLEKEIMKPPKSLLTKEVQEISHAANRIIYDKTNGLLDLPTSIFTVLAGIAVINILEGKPFTFPPSFTLLWWAFNIFKKS